jgi:hypothetical protein
MLLVISIVLQSLTAVASSTSENHQIDIEHLQTQHDNVGDEQHNEKDCHHCGHCSGSHLSWILVSNSNTTGKLNIINKTPYQIDQTNTYLEAILRPPIS